MNTPPTGVYTIGVKAANVPTSAKQPYAITAAGNIREASQQGTYEAEFFLELVDEGIILRWINLNNAKTILIEKNGLKVKETEPSLSYYLDKDVKEFNKGNWQNNNLCPKGRKS